MLKHQESFAKTLAEVYEPISGAKFGTGLKNASVDPSRKVRAITSDEAMEVVHAFHETSTDALAKLTPELVSSEGGCRSGTCT
jgi:hypothetical protein